MDHVSIVRYSPYRDNHELTAQLVDCYREVFSDGPWHEWLRCQKCGMYWGVKDRALLASWKFRHCGQPLEDFWPRAQVIEDLYHEIVSEASCWLAIDQKGKVIGFCWGYPMTISELEKKLGIAFHAELEKELGAQHAIAYQDEVGVITACRGRKIAKAMVIRRLDDFLRGGVHVGIVRTRQSPEPSETFLWYKRLGYLTLASYPDGDGRVILGRLLDDLPTLFA